MMNMFSFLLGDYFGTADSYQTKKKVWCLPMVRETGVQSQVESYQRLLKWYLIPPCLTLSIIRYASRVKWSNPGKGVAFSPTPRCSSYRKGSLLVALDYGHQPDFYYWKNENHDRQKIFRFQ